MCMFMYLLKFLNYHDTTILCLLIKIAFDTGDLCPFNRNNPHSSTKSQTTKSVSLEPETSLTPSASNLMLVIAVL